MRTPLFAIAILGVACSLAVARPPAPLVAFNTADVAWAQGAGTAAIEGQAFLKTRGGDVKYGAGEQVLLVPNSPQSFDWYTHRLATRYDVSPMDPALQALVRTTTSGGDGRFKFENLPAGPYLVVTSVTWEVGYSREGGYIGAPVTAEAGKSTNVIVTR